MSWKYLGRAKLEVTKSVENSLYANRQAFAAADSATLNKVFN